MRQPGNTRPLSPWGRGREAMTCGRVPFPARPLAFGGAAASHLAELVRGDFPAVQQGPLIRPSGTFSPGGEGPRAAAARHS
jgi:hypothetical protein